MIEKAADSNVDYILFDLEDAVAPPDKVNARANIIQALNDIDWKAKGKTVSIRINGLDTHYMYRDVVEILEQADQHLDTILVPKVGVASDLYTVETMVSQIEEAMRFTHKIGLEAKVSFDDNTLFRRPEISELRDKSQEDARETFASDNGLSYIGLEGQIGCIVNGAGLAMATLDMIKMAGGKPANFLDVGGGASPDRVLMSFKAVLNDPKVAEILVNIFAGINRCDWVAEGVIRAMEELNLQIPIVVRL